MKITLKNFKHAAFASQDSNCFDAKVYADGKLIGVAYNDGRGGETTFRANNKEEFKLFADAHGPAISAKRDAMYDSWCTKERLRKQRPRHGAPK